MAKKISDHDRIIDYAMSEPIEAVERMLKTINRILKNRMPKPEKAPKRERKSRNSGESVRTATAGQSSQGE